MQCVCIMIMEDISLRLQVLTAVKVNVMVLWVVTL